ncbi:hypothetical protein [Niameybacter sp.]|uniref:hypothetical protein n=1 Tax=Niameybacter sp. TaxID=2033640 RepID=UPI002FCAAA81
MDKQRADSIIENYIRPIYGFSLNKMGNLDEAEELAGRITIEIYHVLRHKNDFVDLNSYIFKIAHNVWTKYLQEKTNLKGHCILNDTTLYQHEKNVDEVQVYRKDGGKYIAVADVDTPLHLSFDQAKYNTTSMIRGDATDPRVEGWQMGTYWSERKLDWRDNLYTDYLSLYHFIKGQLIESEITAPTYSRLLEKEYLVKTDSGYKVNIVYLFQEEKTKLNALLPKPSEELRNLCLEYDEKVYQLQKVGQPLHMHKTIRYQTQDRLATLWPYVFEHMLTQGVLKLPTKEQQKGISTILHI